MVAAGDITRLETAMDKLGDRLSGDIKELRSEVSQMRTECTDMSGDVETSKEYIRVFSKDMYDRPDGMVPSSERHKEWIKTHEKDHDQDQIRHEKEINNHRWNITTIISFAVLLATIGGLMLMVYQLKQP